jgi:hypothetical protein
MMMGNSAEQTVVDVGVVSCLARFAVPDVVLPSELVRGSRVLRVRLAAECREGWSACPLMGPTPCLEIQSISRNALAAFPPRGQTCAAW